MNWYIGQDIVAVRDHNQGVFKIGDEFKIKGLQLSPCKCGVIEIDIGKSSFRPYTRCTLCETRYATRTDVWYFHERSFAPLDPIKEAISELMERTQVTEI